MNIVVASQNPVKLDAVQEGVEELWPNIDPDIIGLSVPSGVGAQPMTEMETLEGARNRVRRAIEHSPSANYWAGIEGGVQDIGKKMAAFAWVVVSDGEKWGEARSATFFLPDEVAKLVRSGIELGEADDKVFGATNSKQKNGAIGLLTHNTITRTSLYVPAVIMAFIPFIRPEFY
ncbi:MAG: inosine/xanthosine triphosphatase [Bacteroidia bacterium]|nr:inosine/xanthosine triphosphatase [Bacteroidia bacterium]